MKRTRIIGMLFVLSAVALSARAAERPALLVVSPQGTSGGWIDLDYLQELRSAGFEVDYTDSMAEVTWERVRRYNVLVIYSCPPPPGRNAWPFRGAQPLNDTQFIALIQRFLDAGGGVLLMAVETQINITLVRKMIQAWGADLPLERITDPTHTAPMSRMPKVPLAYTDQIAASPVSDGVHGIWYPTQPHYNGADTLPLVVDASWDVVVWAMPSARTVAVDLAKSSRPGPPNPLVRVGGVSAPPLFAIRDYAAGRLALLAQWPIYSIGAGTKWLYNREVLSRGLDGRASDMGRLLINTFRWLATPSMSSRTLGGYTTPPKRLEPPNLQAATRAQFNEPVWTAAAPRSAPLGENAPLLKGLIGAQTHLTGGQGTVADYAVVARRAGLDFLVFLEDFGQLDAQKLTQLKTECAQQSDDALRLFAGYRIDTNIGNHMFAFGPAVALPPNRLLTGANKKLFMLQGETKPGVFGPTPPVAMEFLFGLTPNTQIGYYDFAHSGMGMRPQDVRLYGMLAVRTYRNGALREDITDDYLTATQATLSGVPVSVHLLTSPTALQTAVTAHQGITYAAARNPKQLWQEALHYSNQYTCPNVFTSTGPLIVRWPTCARVTTFGAEPFVTGRSHAAARIEVVASRGLREVRLYNGGELFRRFLPGGETAFSTMLHLDATLQRNLVLVAEDMAGGRAVSAAFRSWKDGSPAPVFCSDRINDCAYMLLARGPYPMTVLRTPELADAGFTWDGGPRGILTPIDFEGSSPLLISTQRQLNGEQFNQTPLLETADEGSAVVRSVRDELIDERVRAINPWNTYGPRAPARLFDFQLRYVQFDRPNTGVPPVGWAAFPSQAGCNAALFEGEVTIREPLDVAGLRLLRNWNWNSSLDLRLAVGRHQRVIHDLKIADVTWHGGPPTTDLFRQRIRRGDWFGFYSPGTANSQLFVNRERPFELRLARRQDGDWLSIWAAVPPTATAGQRYAYELFSVGCPLDASVHDAAAFAEQLAYLTRPDGLRITRGRRVNRPGTLELRPDQFAVQVSLQRPDPATNLTVPVIVSGLNRRWTAALWQRNGFVRGDYGTGRNRYRAVGVDQHGRAHIPLYPDLADETDVEIGHPVVADARGTDLFIQVTALSGGTDANPEYVWHVDVNNPTERPITTVMSRHLTLPGFPFVDREISLDPGEHRVLSASGSH